MLADLKQLTIHQSSPCRTTRAWYVVPKSDTQRPRATAATRPSPEKLTTYAPSKEPMAVTPLEPMNYLQSWNIVYIISRYIYIYIYTHIYDDCKYVSI